MDALTGFASFTIYFQYHAIDGKKGANESSFAKEVSMVTKQILMRCSQVEKVCFKLL